MTTPQTIRHRINYTTTYINSNFPKILVHNITDSDDPTVDIILSGPATPTGEFFIVEFPFEGFGVNDNPNKILVKTKYGAYYIVKNVHDYIIDGGTLIGGITLITFDVDGGGT